LTGAIAAEARKKNAARHAAKQEEIAQVRKQRQAQKAEREVQRQAQKAEKEVQRQAQKAEKEVQRRALAKKVIDLTRKAQRRTIEEIISPARTDGETQLLHFFPWSNHV